MDPAPPRAEGLLAPELVRTLELLRRRLVVRARSGAQGEHLGKRRGGSAEFHEHRPYAPGDDVRRIDWAAFARTDEPVVKTFRLEEDVVVHLVCDTSASLGLGAPPKLDAAKRTAAALGYLALASSERVGLAVAESGSAALRPPVRGRAALPALLQRLDALRAGGRTDLTKSIDTLVRAALRPGWLVVLSDFLDPGPFLGALGRAASGGHDVALVHLVSKDELSPALEGDLALEDVETGALVEVTVDAAALAAYTRRFAAHCEGLAAFARKRGGTYVRVRSDEPLEAPLTRLVTRAVDEAPARG
jgi:uncharacterized protein (DUF58 family)